MICERVSSRSVHTKSGSLYVLVGKIDEELMAERGLTLMMTITITFYHIEVFILHHKFC